MTESQVKKGILRLEGDSPNTWVNFSCQPTSVAIVPEKADSGSGDSLEVLCGSTLTGVATTSALKATLDITAVSDFLDPQGLIAYSWKHNGQNRKFEWVPNGNPKTANPAGDPDHKWTGTVAIHAFEVGGTVSERLLPSLSWQVVTLRTPDSWGGQYVIGTGPAVTGLAPLAANSLNYHLLPDSAALFADLAALQADANVGTTALTTATTPAWKTGTYLLLGDGSQAHWTGSAWVAGAAP